MPFTLMQYTVVLPPAGGTPNDALTLSDNTTVITLSDGSTIVLAYPF